MPRFFLPPREWNDERPVLTGAEAHHCVDVLRMKSGDSMRVFNGLGVEVVAEIVSASRNRVECRALERMATAPPRCRITLAQAIPKGKNMELVIEKATELGVSEIVPLLTTRTVVQLNAADAEKKREKWQRVAIEAAKQCGQNWLPAVRAPQSLRTFFEGCGACDLRLIGSLEKDAYSLKAVLEDRLRSSISSALILIGPEGDFAPDELALARENRCAPITLGPIVLRTETAAIYCLSVLGYELLE